MLVIALYVSIGLLMAAEAFFRVRDDWNGSGARLERVILVAVPVLLTVLFWPLYLLVAAGRMVVDQISKRELIP